MNPRRIVRTFMPQFAPLVESGEKLQTVRPTPKVMPRVGDLFDGRAWTGSPYRSKQRRLIESPITRVEFITVHPWPRITLGGRDLSHDEARSFEIADGFPVVCSFWWFLLAQHRSIPFTGIVIHWSKP
jgi:hypothetical protein